MKNLHARTTDYTSDHVTERFGFGPGREISVSVFPRRVKAGGWEIAVADVVFEDGRKKFVNTESFYVAADEGFRLRDTMLRVGRERVTRNEWGEVKYLTHHLLARFRNGHRVTR